MKQQRYGAAEENCRISIPGREWSFEAGAAPQRADHQLNKEDWGRGYGHHKHEK